MLDPRWSRPGVAWPASASVPSCHGVVRGDSCTWCPKEHSPTALLPLHALCLPATIHADVRSGVIDTVRQRSKVRGGPAFTVRRLSRCCVCLSSCVAQVFGSAFSTFRYVVSRSRFVSSPMYQVASQEDCGVWLWKEQCLVLGLAPPTDKVRACACLWSCVSHRAVLYPRPEPALRLVHPLRDLPRSPCAESFSAVS
jgi:hypothetical protein